MGGPGGKEESEENVRASVGFEAGGVLPPESGWTSGLNTQPDWEALGGELVCAMLRHSVVSDSL